jgi:hypothetical protein
MNNAIYKVGFWSGLIAFVSTVAFFIVQMLQIYGVLRYPWDEILIYGFSFCIVIPFILEMLALHHAAPVDKKLWSHAALIFTVMYGVFVSANYIVQLATVIPMTLKGASGEIPMLIQTPHSLFWDFDAMGYIFMGLATLFAVPVFKKQGLQRWVRNFFLIHGLVTTPLISFVYFYPNFSDKLLFIGIPWGITAPMSMLLLAILFRKRSLLNMIS